MRLVSASTRTRFRTGIFSRNNFFNTVFWIQANASILHCTNTKNWASFFLALFLHLGGEKKLAKSVTASPTYFVRMYGRKKYYTYRIAKTSTSTILFVNYLTHPLSVHPHPFSINFDPPTTRFNLFSGSHPCSHPSSNPIPTVSHPHNVQSTMYTIECLYGICTASCSKEPVR